MSAEERSGETKRILVVDDVAVNRRLLRAMLEGEGYAVFEAADGVEALTVLEKRAPIDGMISDILMPNMDGYRLCHEVRRSGRWQDLPFIFYSSTYRSSEDEALARHIGGDRFLTKPASTAQIVKVLNEVLAARRATHPVPTLPVELGLMRQYSARLVAKLEEQNAELHGRNRELEGEVAAREIAEREIQRTAQSMRALAHRLVDVQETTQRHISRELHDRTGQNLAALGINLDIIDQLMPGERPARLAERLRDCKALLAAIVGSVRQLTSELRPAVLDEYGLLAALRSIAQEHRARAGLEVEIAGVEPQPRLPGAIELALFRIAQEALANVLKHSTVHHARLDLQVEAGRITLTIADDGIGFDPATAAPDASRAHWGLTLMRERAEAVGASLRVESAHGAGTRVMVELASAA